ncbi:MAG: sugar phosphate isomerase/epimerase family protein [Propionicimonas sp.]|nr:sugar phosphate isomerase/epimerase family protein [Propionicimonas sp.]
MGLQHVDAWRQDIDQRFAEFKADHPERLERRLEMSWSNWGFGQEALEVSVARLAKASLKYIELHGNHYGRDLGYRVADTAKILADNGITAAGVCGMFSAESEFASTSYRARQAAIDYTRREIDFCREIGGSYLLVVPAAAGRTKSYDDYELHRSVETLQRIGDDFVAAGIKGAVEPIRKAETTIVHTVADAVGYIEAVGHPGIQHINGDVYHMQAEEPYVPNAVLEAGDRLLNLHMADSNRAALGRGSLDVDTVIKALYLIGYNQPGRYVTPEPLGSAPDVYPAMHALHDPKDLDNLVFTTASYWREREDAVRA